MSSPGCPPSWRAVGVRCPRAVGAGVRAWGPSTVPFACMPCGGLHAAGVVGHRPGKVAFHRCQERLVSGAVPPPAAQSLGRAARALLPVFPGRGLCWRGDPAAAPQRALLRAGVARCEGGGTPSSEGGGPRRCEGAPGIRRSPSSGCPSVGRGARARRSLAVGAGVWVWVYRPSVGRGPRRGCVWCVWCMCGVCEVLLEAESSRLLPFFQLERTRFFLFCSKLLSVGNHFLECTAKSNYLVIPLEFTLKAFTHSFPKDGFFVPLA